MAEELEFKPPVARDLTEFMKAIHSPYFFNLSEEEKKEVFPEHAEIEAVTDILTLIFQLTNCAEGYQKMEPEEYKSDLINEIIRLSKEITARGKDLDKAQEKLYKRWYQKLSPKDRLDLQARRMSETMKKGALSINVKPNA